LGGGLTGDRSILDAPELGVAIPAFERLAIEDRLEASIRGKCGAGDHSHNE
jgi:hypothetical protein